MSPELLASPLTANDEVVDELRHQLSSSNYGLEGVPKLVKTLIRGEMWQRRVIRATGELAEFERFQQFVEAPPLDGLGARMKTIARLCTDDKEALDLLDQVTQEKPGPKGETLNNIKEFNQPEGTSAQYALRRLRKDRPDLHEQVIRGELTPHKAMLTAGFRRRSLTVPLDPEPLAQALLRHLDQDQVSRLIALLLSQGREN